MPFIKDDPNINREGRPPKSQALTDIIRQKLEEERDITDKDGKKRRVKIKELFAERALKLAIENEDIHAMKLILNYIDGLPSQNVDLKSESEVILKIIEKTNNGD